MKLWVDDIRNAPDDSWTVARTVTSAISAISRYDFDEISLDHDISHQVVIGNLSRPYPCGETFMAVVYFIAQKYWHEKGIDGSDVLYVSRTNLVPKITIHTSNQVAGDEMAQVLADVGIRSEKQYRGAASRLEMEL